MTVSNRSYQQTILDRSLRWIVSREERLLRQRKNETHYSYVMRMAELAMTAGVLLRYSNVFRQAEHGRVAKRWIAGAWHSLGSGEDIIREIDSEDGGAILAASYVPFVAVGKRNSSVENALMSVLPCTESEPIARFYTHAALAQLGFGSRRTAVASFHRWWKITKSVRPNLAAYGITHAAFAFTDLMIRPQGCPRKLRQVIRKCFPRWQNSALKAENWDLLGELLMAGHCIGYECTGSRIWKALAQAQRKDGAMASPRSRLRLAYHPTYAVLMASGLCLMEHAKMARDHGALQR